MQNILRQTFIKFLKDCNCYLAISSFLLISKPRMVGDVPTGPDSHVGDRDDKYTGERNNHACLSAVPPTDFARRRCVPLHICIRKRRVHRASSLFFFFSSRRRAFRNARRTRASVRCHARFIARDRLFTFGHPSLDLPNY